MIVVARVRRYRPEAADRWLACLQCTHWGDRRRYERTQWKARNRTSGSGRPNRRHYSRTHTKEHDYA